MPKHNYIDKWTCIGMMNKNCFLLDGDVLGFSKTKSKSKVAVFSRDFVPDLDVNKNVSWLYLDEEPSKEDFDSVYSLEEIVSKIDGRKWFWQGDKKPDGVLAGEDFIEWRGTANKWSRFLKDGSFKIDPLDSSNIDAVIEMIEKWRYLDNGGMKYGWQERAGCDKALARRYVDNFEGIQDYVIGNVFSFKDEVIGYSCIEKRSLSEIDGFPEIRYLTRKVLNKKGFRNVTEFIDYKTIESSYMSLGCPETILVNWGASSGGVHWYKTHKFPVYSLEKKWFASKKMQIEKESR